MSVIDKVVNCGGDLSKLTVDERAAYYKEVCTSVGLNPLTEPFKYIVLNNKLTLYATKSATEQLRKINGISLQIAFAETVGDVYIVRARATDKDGRSDESTGAVSLVAYNETKGKYDLTGDALANAIMKAETKAKRRVTLSISGLGYLDESEIETIPEVHFPEPETTPDNKETKTEKAKTGKAEAKTDKKAEEKKPDKAPAEPEKAAEKKSDIEPEKSEPEMEYQVVIFGFADAGQKIVFVTPEEIAAMIPEAVLIWEEKFPEGTALDVIGRIDGENLIPSTVSVVAGENTEEKKEKSEDTSETGTQATITLTSPPKKAVSVDGDGNRIETYFAYCEYSGAPGGAYAVGDSLVEFAEGDILSVVISRQEPVKNGNQKLYLSSVAAA